MLKIYKWLNKEKERFYTIAVKKEESTIILSHQWGSCISKRGNSKNLLVKTDEELKKCLIKMMKRRKSRGYELIAPLEI